MTKVEEQTEQICTALAELDADQITDGLMLYVMDMTFEREAICRAETRLRKAADTAGKRGS